MAKKSTSGLNTEKDWEAEGDAYNLAQAVEIRNDKKRFERAVKAAKKLAKEREDEAESMKAIAEEGS